MAYGLVDSRALFSGEVILCHSYWRIDDSEYLACFLFNLILSTAFLSGRVVRCLSSCHINTIDTIALIDDEGGDYIKKSPYWMMNNQKRTAGVHLAC